MRLRAATTDDAEAIHAIYAPLVARTAISFELEAPSTGQMRERIGATLAQFPWLVSVDSGGIVDGYACAGRHRERAAYQWSVDTAVYVRADARGTGIGKRLYGALFEELVRLGYFQAFAGIALPNAASVALHESVGFSLVGVYRDVGYKLDAWRDVGWWQKRLQALRAPAPPGRIT